MSRLIDADKLIFDEQHYNKSQMKAILDFIDAQPTDYDVDKVVEELQKIGTSYCTNVNCNNECCDCDHGCLMGAIIGTVKRGVKND